MPVTRFDDCECVHDTGLACLVIIPELVGNEKQPHLKDTGQFWIPKRAIHDDSEVYEIGTSGTLVVFDWFAENELG